MTEAQSPETQTNDWSVYIVQCGDNSLYTGISNHVARRITQHQNGTGAKYTRSRGPITLRYQEDNYSRSDALKREHVVKKLSRAQKLALIKNLASHSP